MFSDSIQDAQRTTNNEQRTGGSRLIVHRSLLSALSVAKSTLFRLENKFELGKVVLNSTRGAIRIPGNGGKRINVATDKQQWFAGDEIRGVVHLYVTSSNGEGSSADRLMLRLVGLEKTRIIRKSRHDGTSSRHANVQKNKFLSHEMQLESFAGKATTGSHSFPFSLALPPGLPPSTEGSSTSTRRRRPSSRSWAKSRTPPLPRRCWWDPRLRRMSIGFEAHRSVVGINEPVRLTVVARNDSSSSVPSMHIKIVQVCTWYARGHKESKTRTVASMIVPGSQLGEVQRAAEENNKIGQKTAAGKDAGRLYLQIVWPLGLELVTRYPSPMTTFLPCKRA